MGDCSCRVGVATQAGSVRSRNGLTRNMTLLAVMWLIDRLVPRAMHKIIVRSSGGAWGHPGRSAAVVENERCGVKSQSPTFPALSKTDEATIISLLGARA